MDCTITAGRRAQEAAAPPYTEEGAGASHVAHHLKELLEDSGLGSTAKADGMAAIDQLQRTIDANKQTIDAKQRIIDQLWEQLSTGPHFRQPTSA